MSQTGKKSEKVEIRLSYEEKQDLLAIAESEGRTTSELVRGLISRYIKLSTTRMPDKRLWRRFAPLGAAIGLGAFFLGHLATAAYTKSHNHAHKLDNIYSMHLGMRPNGPQENVVPVIKVPIVARDGYQTEFQIPQNNGDINISVSVYEPSTEPAILDLTICKQSGIKCETIANPKLYLNPSEQTSIEFGTEGFHEISIRIDPPLPEKTSAYKPRL